MVEAKSLRAEILERLQLQKGGKATASRNIGKATKDFSKSNAPQFQGKSQKKRHQMAVAAGLSAARGESVQNRAPALTESTVGKGSKVLYQNKPVVLRELNESSGMALIKMPRQRDPVFVRIADLQQTQALNEGFLGMAEIPHTYLEPRQSMMRLETLSAADIGLFEEDPVDSDYGDDQEEDADNGSNKRHDGHTGRTEVDNLPTPSDTIAPAYDDQIPPKQEGKPLSTAKGAEPGKLWQEPDWDGYDYPADAPDIPTAEFPGAEIGNARAPDQSDHHDGGDGLENRKHDDSEPVDEAYDHEHADWKEPVSDEWRAQQKRREGRGLDRKTGKKIGEGFSFVSEDGGMADRYVDFMDKGGTDQDFMAAGGNVKPGIIPQPRAMGSAMAHQEQYGNMTPVRSGMGPTEIPPGFNAQPVSASANPMVAGKPGPMQPATDSGAGSPAPAMGAGGPGTFMNPARMEHAVMANYKKLLSEMDDMLGGGEDREPHEGDTITLTLPAMASVVCTIANKVGNDPMLMKAIIEALAEVGHGKTIDLPDLEAVACHVNGEEAQEVENRAAGRPDHEGIENFGGGDSDDGGEADGEHHFDSGHDEGGDHEGDDEGGSDDYEAPPGDGESTKDGKKKLFGGMGESKMPTFDYYGLDDIVRESEMTEEDEIRLVKKRAGMKYW